MYANVENMLLKCVTRYMPYNINMFTYIYLRVIYNLLYFIYNFSA